MDTLTAWIPFTFPGIENVRCAFGMRPLASIAADPLSGNISYTVGDAPENAAQNRRAMRDGLGFAVWRSLKQVHGTAMSFTRQPDNADRPGSIEADGHATNEPGQGLVIKTADCQPLLLAHKDGCCVAALHVGWRGNRLDFPGKGVAAFCRRYGLSPGDLMAVRGPSLSPPVSEFVNFDEEFGPDFEPWFDRRTQTVNLWRLTRDQLVRAGLDRNNIFGLDLCAYTRPEFFSHRRDKRAGRQASVIWMEERP